MQNKKYRRIEHAFLIEGLKNVCELLVSDYKIIRVLATPKVFDEIQTMCKKKGLVCDQVSEQELASLGTLENNQTALAIASTREPKTPSLAFPLTLVLDNINDPGNLGTILRIADWYGIRELVCSEDTVDFYNPKVVNASKGSFTRVSVSYQNLTSFLSLAKQKGMPIIAASLEGSSLYSSSLGSPSLLIMGNEANGISLDLLPYVSYKVCIPRIGSAESLNVGVATGIIVDRLVGKP